MAKYSKNKQPKVDYQQKNAEYEEYIANLFLKAIENGTAPWTKPWTAGQMCLMRPFNPETGVVYSGVNSTVLLLAGYQKGYTDSRWLTFNQAKAAGGTVRRGEHGITLRKFIFTQNKIVLDENGKTKFDENGKPIYEEVILERPIIKTFTVFNVQQINFAQEHKYSRPIGETEVITEEQIWENYEKAEQLIQATKADIIHGGGRAFYSPSEDCITIPPKEKFKTQEGYYSTVLHELSHWTGHESRLNRDIKNTFGEQDYAKEELVAEISSFMLCMKLGIGHNLENHASYVNSWSKNLKDKPAEIYQAAKKAKEAQQFITKFAQEKTLDEDRIYLTSDQDKWETLIAKGAIFDEEKNLFYITEESHDISKFTDYLLDKKVVVNTEDTILSGVEESNTLIIDNDLKQIFVQGKEQGFYSNIDFATFKQINDLLPEVETENYERADGWSKWDNEPEYWSRPVIINAVSNDKNLLNYVLKEKELPPLVYLHWSESSDLKSEFTSRDTNKLLPLAEANRILDKANNEYKEIGYYKSKVSLLYVQKEFDKTTDYSYTDARYDIGSEKGDLITHIEDYCKWIVDHKEGNWISASEYKDQALPLIKDKSEKYENYLSESNQEIKSVKFDKTQNSSNTKKSTNKEKISLVLEQAIDCLKSLVIKENLTEEERDDFISQLGIMVSDSETLKEKIKIENLQDIKVERIDNQDILELDKREVIKAFNQNKQSDENDMQYGIPEDKETKPKYKVYIKNTYFHERTELKELGAKWDSKEKSWYVISDEHNPKGFEKWFERSEKKIERNNNFALESTEDAINEMLNDMRENGMIINRYNLSFDGSSAKGRCRCEGDHNGQESGWYCIHLDGCPVLIMQNHKKQSSTMTKKYPTRESYQRLRGNQYGVKQYSKQIATEYNDEIKQNELDYVNKSKQYEAKSLLLTEEFNNSKQASTEESAYLQSKGVEVTKGIYMKVVKDKHYTCIPFFNIEGKITTKQYIDEQGNKRFETGGKKTGSFHVINGFDMLNTSTAGIIIAEGYATANTVNDATNGKYSVVAAGDCGNLENVAKAIRSKYPTKDIIIAADNDHIREDNVGLKHATQAAKNVGAMLVYPSFSFGVKASDFNDLKKISGIEVVRSSIREQLLTQISNAKKLQHNNCRRN